MTQKDISRLTLGTPSAPADEASTTRRCRLPSSRGEAYNDGVRIFIAGASGVIGQRLIPRLVQAGHVVGGMTRSPSKMELLRHLGAEPILCDVFDRKALIQAVRDFKPDAVLNELTDLPDDAARISELAGLNARIVPTDIEGARAGGGTASGSGSASPLKCYRAQAHGLEGTQSGIRNITVSDAMKRTWTFEVGEAESLCRPLDNRGRELGSSTPSLVSYRIRDLKTAGADQRTIRVPIVNEFGARMLRLGQPELLFLASQIE
jgi:NAD dependent epimerase/dehydratase family